jgi:dolichol-phosphate mannosyltransferase
MSTPELSVVVPVHNEQDNLAPLIEEIERALDPLCRYEIVYVDDMSRDGTRAALAALKATHPNLRVLGHSQQSGQSTAVRSGVKAARAPWIATLDGDGQNDPADIPKLWSELKASNNPKLKMLAGWRADRRDDWVKRLSSTVANAVRSRLLGDATPDTGCGLKLFDRALFLELPYFDHMHRFLPALVRRAGYIVQSVKVNHRPRTKGISKYGIGNRLWVGLSDLRGVRWLNARSKLTDAPEL